MANKALAGGLLTGIGEGLKARGQNAREDAEAMRAAALERAKEVRERLAEEDAARLKHERERGLLSRTATGEGGKLWGITKGGEKIDLGITTPEDSGSSPSGSGGSGEEVSGLEMSAAEKRIYEEVKARYTNPSTNRTDWQGFIGHLRDMPAERGGDRWNEIADHLTGSIGLRMTREEAREQAVSEARQRTGLLSSRESEFPETGGDQQEWIKMRTEELLGGSAAKGASSGAVGQQKQQRGQPEGQRKGGGLMGQSEKAQAGQSASTVPPGSGTEQDPYRATDQAQIDWFLENAQAGAIIDVNGKLYTK